MDHHGRATPKLLESSLASDPEFFCEVLRLIYRSKKKDRPQKEPTEESKAIATKVWGLLHEWRTPPGVQEDGVFNQDHFINWLQRVKIICTESGHLEVAFITIGEVLIHAPADPDNLWIHRTIAEALNARDSEAMRNGYRAGVYNARGVYCIDPTGKPEKELATKFGQQAEEVENAGFQRFATTLRGLANSYEREAEGIVSEYKQEDSV